MIPVVLKGQQTAKFLIKGRHLWPVYVPSSKPDLYAWCTCAYHATDAGLQPEIIAVPIMSEWINKQILACLV
jgi:hypothetical protein